jgi:hypothetical protein
MQHAFFHTIYLRVFSLCKCCIFRLNKFQMSHTLIDIMCPRDRRDHDRMVIGFTITYAISAYHH